MNCVSHSITRLEVISASVDLIGHLSLLVPHQSSICHAMADFRLGDEPAIGCWLTIEFACVRHESRYFASLRETIRVRGLDSYLVTFQQSLTVMQMVGNGHLLQA